MTSINPATKTPDEFWNEADHLLRLFHVLMHDDILPLLTESMSSEDLDHKDNFGKQLDLWSKVAVVYNDITWTPNTFFLPTLHNDFKMERPLPAPVQKKKMKDIFNQFTKYKNDVLSVRAWVFKDQKYKKMPVKPTIVSLMRTSETDERYGALHAFPPSVLYLWHLEDAFQWSAGVSRNIVCEGGKHLSETRFSAEDNKNLQYFLHEETPETKAKEMGIENAEDWLMRLQSSELHHADLAKSFADMLSKISLAGGKQHELLTKVADDIVGRVDASYNRCTAIESAMHLRQQT